MNEYLIIYEWTGSNYSAYAPDLPGCIACGDTMEETEHLMKDAISLYIDELKKDGQAIPEATTKARMMVVGINDCIQGKTSLS